MPHDTEVPCPSCGQRDMEASLMKEVAEGVTLLLVRAEQLKNMALDGTLESTLGEHVESLECSNCGNTERRLDETLVRRGIEAEREKEK